VLTFFLGHSGMTERFSRAAVATPTASSTGGTIQKQKTQNFISVCHELDKEGTLYWNAPRAKTY